MSRSLVLYYLIKGVVKLLQLLPLPAAEALGRFLGWFWYYVLRIRKKVMLENLSLAFGKEKTPEELHRIARKVLTYQVFNVIENIIAPKYINRETVDRYVDYGAYHKNRAVIDGGGVLILTAHFGNWELQGLATSLNGVPLTVIIKPFKNKTMSRLVEEYREEFGFRTLPASGSRQAILEQLSQGVKMAFVFDQNATVQQGVFAKFFGRTASTYRGLARFAQLNPYPVVPAFCIREGFMRHRMLPLEQVPFERCGDPEEEILINTQRYNDIIEAVIRRYPEQWMWLHKRWKTQPAGWNSA